MSVFFTRRGKAADIGKMLGDFAEGDIVYISEGGADVPFFVSKHDYESGLNGTGRTLLVRQEHYDSRPWNNTSSNAYATSSIDSWLNGEYKGLFSAKAQEAMDSTEFYYTPSNGANVTTLSRAVFLLSVTEYRKTDSAVNVEGSALPIAQTLISNLGTRWTRSLRKGTAVMANRVASSTSVPGGLVQGSNVANNDRVFPCFTFPLTARFDPDTNKMIG